MLSIAPLAGGGPGITWRLANINYYMEGERGEPMPYLARAGPRNLASRAGQDQMT